MKQTFKRGVSLVLALVMVIGLIPFTAFAANDYTINSTVSTDDFYNLISKRDWDIAPGITESEIVLNNDAGTRRQVLFVMEADLNNEYVKVINSYNGMVPTYGNYKTGVMSEQARLAEELGYGNVVGAMNTCLSWYTGYSADRVGEPLGFIMLDAEILFDPANCGYTYGNVGFPSVVVINKDFDENGNPRPADIPKVEMPQIRSSADLDGWEDQVIPVSSGYIVKNGVSQYPTPNHKEDSNNSAPRSVVGIKPDGTVVIMLNDGRQSPYSAGMSMYELAEVMLDLGCSYAVNCDGGGSSTFLSQRPGEELKVNNSPSDGAERETTTGILFISTAPATGEFVRANISSENDYYTPNSVVKFDAIGTDLVGTEAAIPADAIWQLADASYGTIENGVFTSNGKQGEVVVQIVHNGAVVGEDTIYIVMPDKIEFAQNNMVIPFGKTVDIIINATYDSKPVVLKAEDVEFSLSNNVIGTISAFTFTSAPEGTEVEPAVLTAAIGDLTITANISLGKGTEIVYDFENQDIVGWSIKTNYGQYGPMGSNKDENGNYYFNGQNELGYISVVDASTGKVRNGNYALAMEIDFTQIYETGFHALNMRFPKIDTTDAVSVGFWIYVPYDARFSDLTINSVLGEKFFADGSAMELCEGWHYVKLNAPSAENGFYGISINADERASAKDKNGNPYYDHITTPNLNGKYTFYIDDISVDYSTAVEDRENPVFSAPMVMDSVGSVNAVVNGQTILFSNPTFEAKVSDFVADNATGLDAASAKAYVDGKEVACTFANGKISVNGITLTDGVHNIKFAISDNAGNSSWIGGSVNVNAGNAPVVSVVPQNPDADRLLIGSLYWLDVKATDIEDVQKIELRFDLNNASYWELEGMNVAHGFKAEWAVQADDNIATITLERTGETLVTGEAVIASIPVRTWESHITEYEGYEDQTPAVLVKRGIIWAQSIELVLEKGVVTYTDNTVDTFGMKDILVDTELFFTNYTRKSVAGAEAWKAEKIAAGVGFHEHTAVTLDDKAATCKEAGYTGRTFCEVCNSVVEWGTMIPVADHEYEVVEGKLTCVLGGELFNGVYTDGKTYVDGVIMADGWHGESYYRDGVMLTGVQLIDGKYYNFGVDGICANGYPMSAEWWTNENGESFYLNNGVPTTEYALIGGAPTTFDKNGVAFQGEVEINGEICVFEKGVFVTSTTADVIMAGRIGPDAFFVYYANGTLVVCGEGATYNFVSVGSTSLPNLSWKNRPWGRNTDLSNGIKKIVIGKDITVLGDYFAYQCYNVEEIVFEEGSKLTNINRAVFNYLLKLKSVELPESLRSIGNIAFAYNSALVNVKMPQAISYIQYNAFNNCPKVVLDVAEGTYAENFAISSKLSHTVRPFVEGVLAEGTFGDGLTWTFYESGKLVVGGEGEIPNFTSRDAQPWAAYRDGIYSIEIGKDITYIGNYAFAYAYYVKSVTFEEGSKLNAIGAAALYYLNDLTELELPDSLKRIGNIGLAYNAKLVNVKMPQAIAYIQYNAFRNSSKVVLNVAEGTYAESFAVNNKLAHTVRPFVEGIVAEGTFGDGLTWTFYESGKLVVGGEGEIPNFTSRDAQPWAAYRDGIYSIVIGKDITYIGNYAFAYAYYVQSVTFEEGSKLNAIGAAALYYLNDLTALELPASLKRIGNIGLAYNAKLINVKMPQSIAYIQYNAFRNSSKVVLDVAEGTYAENFAITNNLSYTVRAFVESVTAEGTFGDGLTWTLYESGKLVIDGEGAMPNFNDRSEQPWAAYRDGIYSIVIGKDITYIGNFAFAYAHSVKSVTFEEGSKLNAIGTVALYYLSGLTELTLPETVTKLGKFSLAYNAKLVNVYVPSAITYIEFNTFTSSGKVVLNVADGSYAEEFAVKYGIAFVER